MDLNLGKIVENVISISKEAGKIIKENIGEKSNYNVYTKGTNDFVTNIDKKSEDLIVSSLKPLISGAGFIAEENNTLQLGREFNWIVDPLDGTTNFINGLFPCSVSIALKRNEEIILGVVYEVGYDECFHAYKGAGAFLNGKRITVSSEKKMINSLLSTGFPYNAFERLENYMELLEYFIKNAKGIRRLGSAATDLAYVACGRFEGFYEYDLKPYDVAAGAILVKEAGGDVCDFKGGNNYIFGKEIVASNSYIFEDFSTKVIEYMNT